MLPLLSQLSQLSLHLSDTLVDLMGRWREKQHNKDPGVMRARYYGGMRCEDCVTVTSSAPPRSHIGFCAWYSFE